MAKLIRRILAVGGNFKMPRDNQQEKASRSCAQCDPNHGRRGHSGKSAARRGAVHGVGIGHGIEVMVSCLPRIVINGGAVFVEDIVVSLITEGTVTFGRKNGKNAS